MRFRLAVLLAAVVACGLGCSRSSGSKVTVSNGVEIPVVAAPASVAFDKLSPEDAAKKLVFVNASSFRISQEFAGKGATYMAQKGYGSSADLQVTVQRFAPGNLTDVSWKALTTATDKAGKSTSRQFDGQLGGSDLKTARELLPPAYWGVGERTAAGTSGIWLSAESYENLAKGKGATLYPGVVPAPEAVKAGDLPAEFAAGVQSLRNALPSWKGPEPTYFLSAAEPSTYTLSANGKDVKVAVRKAASPLAEITYLDNPQNPLILSYVPAQVLADYRLDGVLGWRVVSVDGIVE